MSGELVNTFRKVINKHYSAVQTDTALDHTDNWKLEKKAKLFWEQYYEVEKEFIAMLERIDA